MNQIQLPPLDIDCPDCTGDAREKILRDNAEEWKAWNAEYEKADEEFRANSTARGVYEDWTRSDTYRDLSARQPEELPEVGCVECEWTGKRITEFGSQVLAFLHRHTKLK